MEPGSTLQVVVDTDVFIAGLRSRQGAAFRVIESILSGLIRIHLSVPVVLEYEEVLKAQSIEIGMTYNEIEQFIDLICRYGVAHEIHYLWRGMLRDRDDEMLLDLAMKSGCDYLVTRNTKDFVQGVKSFDVRLITPVEFIRLIVQ